MVGAGVATALVIVAVAAVVVGGIAMGVSAAISADAQRDVASINAEATKFAAQKAMEGQVESAKQDAMARMHSDDVAFKQEQEYIKSEKWFANREADEMSYQESRWNELDDISMDIQYVDESGWGAGAESGYDYGYDSGGGAGV